MPGDEELRAHLAALTPETLRTLRASGARDTLIVGGEEVDIDLFYQSDAPVYVARPTPPQDPRTPLDPGSSEPVAGSHT
jgi:hypothetical protein